MARRDKLLCVVAAALSGALLGLAGAPAVPDLPPPTPARETAEPAPLRRTVIEGPPAPAPSVAERTRAPRARPDLPSDVRLCWSPTARRLLGEKVHGHLESLGARVRACTESDRGARGRLLRGADDLAIVAGNAHADEAGLHSVVLGYHVLVAVVHERSPVFALPRHTLRAALVGEATEWQHIGVPLRAPIVVAGVAEDPFTDQAASLALLGDRLARGWLRLGDDRAVVAHVARDPQALGFCSLAAVEQDPGGVRLLRVDGVAPSPQAWVTGQYPFGCPIRALARDPRCLAWLTDLAPGDALSRLP